MKKIKQLDKKKSSSFSKKKNPSDSDSIQKPSKFHHSKTKKEKKEKAC